MFGEYLLFPDSWDILPYMFACIVTVLFVSMFTVLMGILLLVYQIARDQGLIITRRRKKRVVINNPSNTARGDGSATEAEPTHDTNETAQTNGQSEARNEPIEIVDLNQWGRLIMVLVNSNKLYVAIVVFLMANITIHVSVLMVNEIIKCWKFAMWDTINDTVKIVASNVAESTMTDKAVRSAPVIIP